MVSEICCFYILASCCRSEEIRCRIASPLDTLINISQKGYLLVYGLGLSFLNSKDVEILLVNYYVCNPIRKSLGACLVCRIFPKKGKTF
ncbi:unnamed protein product [Brassica napus]|nr:unnamed protein product [Brassica napus]